MKKIAGLMLTAVLTTLVSVTAFADDFLKPIKDFTLVDHRA